MQFNADNRLAKIHGMEQLSAGVSGTIATGVDTSVGDVWFYVYTTESNVFSIPPSVSVSGATIYYSGAGAVYFIIYGSY